MAADDTGRLQGTEAIPSVRRGLGGFVTTTTYTTDGAPNSLFDLMSYCAGENNAWLSGRNWNRVFINLEQKAATLTGAADQPARRGRAAGPDPAVAIGTLGVGGAQIDRVIPARRQQRT